jgi:hypothetical protein
MKKDGLQDKRLHAPLKPGLDYYDATPSIEALALEVRDLKQTMQVQGEINLKLINLVSDLTNRIEVLEENRQKNPLILPPRMQ